MTTNTDCTVYIKTDVGYDTVYVPACYWQDVKAYEVKKYGAENADSVKIIIPLSAAAGIGTGGNISEGSRIAKGSPAISVTDDISPLIGAGIPVFYISSVSEHFAGSENIRHITIGAK